MYDRICFSTMWYA